MGKKSGSLPASEGARPKRELHPKMIEKQWKPGMSGNPLGAGVVGYQQTKKLTNLLVEEVEKLAPGKHGKAGKTLAHLLVQAFIKRAIKKSDVLMKEAFDRLEGKLTPSEETVGKIGVEVVILDCPRPDRSEYITKPVIKVDKVIEATPAKPDPRPKD